ncbi:MAG TPA: vanadium-dependent haloperoxidase [Candidatus Deferrimicrobium sp.]|nr:vanadium-dependent haloperoxidase [Candidatus Deferrimicrobium sp.]
MFRAIHHRRLGGALLAALAVTASLVASSASASAAPAKTACVPTADRSHSVARLWDDAILDAIRRDTPRPTVHARNLYHTSAAMWDAWAAYDPLADGVFVDEKTVLEDPAAVQAAREEAISYAAYRVLRHRYAGATGGKESLREFDRLMGSLCYPVGRATTEGTSPAALGNRIADTIIRTTLKDGSLEKKGYQSGYVPVNDPLIVELPGTVMNDPNRWQPLALEVSYTQNGLPLPVGPQQAVTPHWGNVTSFALPPSDVRGLPIDPGTPPLLGDPVGDREYKDGALGVIRFSAMLDPRDGETVDISPAVLGANPLGTNDGTGHVLNPVTGQPYEADVVSRADFARVLAEFWADGPNSETPPGHWNTIANGVTDSPGFERRLGGQGEVLDPLEWDVKMYLALNGAVHDAGVAAWGCKGHYDTVRPISMIRYMGGLGQSSDPTRPAYHPDGLTLEDGLVEVVTEESAAPGERHEHLADHVGEIAIRTWTGNPEDPENGLGGVDWIRAVEWVPYQLPTFVTPAFPAYVSGHSTFSRAAAEVLTAMTGSEYFPGGLGSWTIPAGDLDFEAGPSRDVPLQWATYYDAADQAGLSRLYGGIHIAADDFRGRVMGSQCGKDAWQMANRYWDGSASA